MAGGDSDLRHGSLTHTKTQPGSRVLVPCFLGRREEGKRELVFNQGSLLTGVSNKDTIIDLQFTNLHNTMRNVLILIQNSGQLVSYSYYYLKHRSIVLIIVKLNVRLEFVRVDCGFWFGPVKPE